MKILALDVATTVGICVGSPDAGPKYWHVHLGEAPDERRFSQALKMAYGLIQIHKPDLVVIEAPIGGSQASSYLIGLVACIRGVAYNNGVKSMTAHEATVRKHFLGKALTTRDFPTLKNKDAKLAIKREVVKRCQLLGWEPETHDEADAIAIWDWACATKIKGYQSKPLGGLF